MIIVKQYFSGPFFALTSIHDDFADENTHADGKPTNWNILENIEKYFENIEKYPENIQKTLKNIFNSILDDLANEDTHADGLPTNWNIFENIEKDA